MPKTCNTAYVWSRRATPRSDKNEDIGIWHAQFGKRCELGDTVGRSSTEERSVKCKWTKTVCTAACSRISIAPVSAVGLKSSVYCSWVGVCGLSSGGVHVSGACVVQPSDIETWRCSVVVDVAIYMQISSLVAFSLSNRLTCCLPCWSLLPSHLRFFVFAANRPLCTATRPPPPSPGRLHTRDSCTIRVIPSSVPASYGQPSSRHVVLGRAHFHAKKLALRRPTFTAIIDVYIRSSQERILIIYRIWYGRFGLADTMWVGSWKSRQFMTAYWTTEV